MENVIFNIASAAHLLGSRRSAEPGGAARQRHRATNDARGTDQTSIRCRVETGLRRPTTASSDDGSTPHPRAGHRLDGGRDDAAAGQVRSRRHRDPPALGRQPQRVRRGQASGQGVGRRGAGVPGRPRDRARDVARQSGRRRCGRTTSRLAGRRGAQLMCAGTQHAGARKYFEEAVDDGTSRSPKAGRRTACCTICKSTSGSWATSTSGWATAAQARKIFEERLEVRQRRLNAMPGDSQRMTDVSVALDRVGQMIRDQGDLNGSRKYFEEALRIDRALHKRSVDPAGLAGKSGFQPEPDRRSRSPAWPAKRRAGALRRGARAAAPARRRSHGHRAASEPGIAPAERSATSSAGCGSFPAAIAAHREELEIRRRLLAREPNSLTARRNVSSALDYLGNTLRENKDMAGARAAFNEQLELDRSIAKADPNNTTSLTDLAWSLNRIGDLERDTSKSNEAAQVLRGSAGDPTPVDRQRSRQPGEDARARIGREQARVGTGPHQRLRQRAGAARGGA